MHDLIPEQDKKSYALQGVLQLAITGVSVQSTSKLIVNVILNLMKYAEYVPILKKKSKLFWQNTVANGHWRAWAS